jgi:hypothetical protein
MNRILRLAIIAVIAITTFTKLPRVSSLARFAREQIAGGYGDTANDDPEALTAARFAIMNQSRKLHSRISLAAIKRAEVQVVAGLNYRICMTVKIKRKTRTVTVVVYRNLKQKYSLTSWMEGDCGK